MKKEIKIVIAGIIMTIMVIIISFSLFIKRFGIDYLSTEISDWGDFGSYVSGTVGAFIGIISITIVIYQWLSLQREKLLNESSRRIEKIISEHQMMLNSIKLYDDERQGPILRSGVEAMWALYYKFLIPLIHNHIISLGITYCNKRKNNWKILYSINKTIWSCENISNKEKFMTKLEYWLGAIKDVTKDNPKNTHLAVLDSIISLNKPEALIILKDGYQLLFEDVGYIFGHYHRHLFYVLKSIEDSGVSKSEIEYIVKTFRSQLSGAEQIMIFMNILSGYSKSNSGEDKFKLLIDKNKILEDIEKHCFAYRCIYNA